MSSEISSKVFTYWTEAGKPWQHDLPPQCYCLLQDKVTKWNVDELARKLYSGGKNTCILSCFPMLRKEDKDGNVRYVIGDEPNIPKKLRFGGKTTYNHIWEALIDEDVSAQDAEQHLLTLENLTDGYQTKNSIEEQEKFKVDICDLYRRNPIEPRLKEVHFQLTKEDIISLCRPHIDFDVWKYWLNISTIKATKGTPPLQDVLCDLIKMDAVSQPEPEPRVDVRDVFYRLDEINNDDLKCQVEEHVKKSVAYVEKSISIDDPIVQMDELKGMTPVISKWYQRTSGFTFVEPEPESKPDSESISVEPDEPTLFYCPIGHELMKDPVVAKDGQTYERENIEKWFKEYKLTSPLTNETIGDDLLPNYLIRSLIDRM